MGHITHNRLLCTSEDRVFITTSVFTNGGYLNLFPAAGEMKERATLCPYVLDYASYETVMRTQATGPEFWKAKKSCVSLQMLVLTDFCVIWLSLLLYASCSELFFRIVTSSFLPRSFDVRNKQGHIQGVLSWICLYETEIPSLAGVVTVNTKTYEKTTCSIMYWCCDMRGLCEFQG